MLTVRAFDFVPSINGFRFASSDLSAPHIVLALPNGARIGLDEITLTLGGGMTFAVADYARAQIPVYGGPEAPSPGSALYTYLVQRQVYNLDAGTMARILVVMSPDTPDHDEWQYNTARTESRSRAFGQVELPKVRQDIDQHALSQVVLVDAVLRDARQLGVSHRQVCAYSYDALDDGSTLLHVYDPLYPLDDSVTLLVAPTAPSSTLALTYSRAQVAGFFRAPYGAAIPPA